MADDINPAARLFSILTILRDQPDRNLTRNVWAEVAECDSSDTPAILRFIADFINLTSEARTAIEQLENINHEIYLRTFANIDKALSQINLDQNWQVFKQYLDETTMLGLSFGVDTLSVTRPIEPIPPKELERLQKEIDALLKIALSMDLPTLLRDLLVEHLERIRFAVLQYRIRGNEGLRRAVEAAIGASLLRKDLINEVMQDSKKKKPLVAFFSIIEKTTKLLALVEKAKVLAPPALTLLLGGPTEGS